MQSPASLTTYVPESQPWLQPMRSVSECTGLPNKPLTILMEGGLEFDAVCFNGYCRWKKLCLGHLLWRPTMPRMNSP